MVNRKGELNKRAVDTGWPYQVALPADACTGGQYDVVHDFCRGLSLCPRGHYFRRDDVGYTERSGPSPVAATATLPRIVLQAKR